MIKSKFSKQPLDFRNSSFGPVIKASIERITVFELFLTAKTVVGGTQNVPVSVLFILFRVLVLLV